MTDGGWTQSAEAWITSQGETGDFSRAFVLDRPMMARVRLLGAKCALDVGCGEGRFVRMLTAEGIEATGLDPTAALIEAARARDPRGRYVAGKGEALPFPQGHFDLVVAYLSLIDIPDFRAAIAEMARVLKPEGHILVANLTGHATARVEGHLSRPQDFTFKIDHYGEERATWEEWRGIRVLNHHRPLSAYMQAFLAQGLTLTHFDEPKPHGGEPAKADRYTRVPWHLIMEWRKPRAGLG